MRNLWFFSWIVVTNSVKIVVIIKRNMFCLLQLEITTKKITFVNLGSLLTDLSLIGPPQTAATELKFLKVKIILCLVVINFFKCM